MNGSLPTVQAIVTQKMTNINFLCVILSTGDTLCTCGCPSRQRPLTPAAAAAELVARFRRQRPLRAGSLIVTIFGDSLHAARRRDRSRQPHRARGAFRAQRASGAHRDGAARAGRLARGAARGQAQRISPHRRRPRAIRRGHGAHLRRGRQRIGRAAGLSSCCPPCPPHSGSGCGAELAWQGYGELSSGVFAHPQLRASAAQQRRAATRMARPAPWCSMRISPHRPRDAVLIEEGWDLKELAQRYRRLREPLRARARGPFASPPARDRIRAAHAPDP